MAITRDEVEHLIVRAIAGRLEFVRAELVRQGATIDRTLSIIDSFAISIAPGNRKQILLIPGVVAVTDDAEVFVAGGDSTRGNRDKSNRSSTTAAPTPAAPTPAPPTTAPQTEAPAPTILPATTAPSSTAPAPPTTSVPSAPAPTSTTLAEESESRDPGSLQSVARVTGARDLWKKGLTGRGIDVALIDTGIANVPGAPTVISGADLSIDTGNNNLKFLDGFGHGTHMAGIIGGKDTNVSDPTKARGAFVGIAPNSRLVNVKVGAMDGSVHVSQIVAAIDWVVQNRQSNGMNIRVVNLSYGAPATPDWRLDPLAWAAEVAWRKGIVVIAAAGNEGAGHELASPAYSPAVIAVGATEVETIRGGRGDYGVAPFTSTGIRRRPDLYVPGSHIVSLRVKGSFIDTFLARANINDQLTRGTGTSQATAVTSGLAALLLEAFPAATPDQIKGLLTGAVDQEHGRHDISGIETSVDLGDALKSGRRALPVVPVTDPFAACGPQWCRGAGDASPALVAWAKAAWDGLSWSGNQWTGSQWTGSQWTGSQWTGNQWTGSQWTGSQWTGSQWTGSQWTADQWAGSQWSGSQWSGSQWSGSQWSGSQWSGSQWSGSQWSGSQWSGSAWSSSWVP